MDIQWYGHDCFKIKGPDLTVVTDPFDDSLGYSPGPLRADVITVSHLGPHSAHEERVADPRKILRGPGEYELSGAVIMGIRTYCDTSKGSERGLNTVFRIAVDHLAICHLGAIGHTLTIFKRIGDEVVTISTRIYNFTIGIIVYRLSICK